jgi:hypothetical protein
LYDALSLPANLHIKTLPTQTNIQFTSASLRRKNSSWGEISQYLHLVEQSSLWSETSTSFTEWLISHSLFFGIKESTLWRYLTAGRYYNQLREKLSTEQYTCPPLNQLPPQISPENIEILSKIERVVPSDFFTSLAHGVLAGSVKRAELRNIWQNFRPVLLGKTARGRGVESPKFNPINLLQKNNMTESMLFNALFSSDGQWTGVSKPDVYKVFTHIKPLYKQRPEVTVEMDAVVLIQDKATGQIMLHCIEISSIVSMQKLLSLEEQSKYCHRMWIALDKAMLPELHAIPDHVGILAIEGGLLDVVRPASNSPHTGTHTEELSNALLLKTLNH